MVLSLWLYSPSLYIYGWPRLPVIRMTSRMPVSNDCFCLCLLNPEIPAIYVSNSIPVNICLAKGSLRAASSRIKLPRQLQQASTTKRLHPLVCRLHKTLIHGTLLPFAVQLLSFLVLISGALGVLGLVNRHRQLLSAHLVTLLLSIMVSHTFVGMVSGQ